MNTDDLAHIFAFSAYNLEYSHHPDFILRTVLARLCKLDTVLERLQERRARTAFSLDFELNDLLEAAIAGLRARPSATQQQFRCIVVLDGMDEVPSARARTQTLRQLDRLCKVPDIQQVLTFRIVLFSRLDDEISQYCEAQDDWQQQSVLRLTIEPDIDRAIRGRMEGHRKMSRLTQPKKDTITQHLAAKSDGM